MAGYVLQGKTQSGSMVDIPLAATYDASGNEIAAYYAAKTEYENMMAKLNTMDGKLDAIVGLSKDSSFAGASWGTIKAVSEAGLASSLWNVGDEKQITLTTGETVTMVILGFDHDDLASGGKAGITLGTKNCLATSYVMNSASKTYDGNSGYNAGGWLNSDMRNTTMPLIKGYLPSEVKNVIKTVKKKTSKGTLLSTLLETNDELFLFSLEEVMGTINYSTTGQNSFAGEGTQYEYFKNATIPSPTSGTGSFSTLAGTGCFYTSSTSVASGYTNRFGESKSTSANFYYNYNNAKAKGDSATTAGIWWLRSPYYNYGSGFCCVNSGGFGNTTSANNTYGVAFGFCI